MNDRTKMKLSYKEVWGDGDGSGPPWKATWQKMFQDMEECHVQLYQSTPLI